MINETIKTNSKRVWIGDPGYVLKDELWDDFCKNELKNIITVNHKGKEYSFIQCEAEQGFYSSETGFEYSVEDSCLLAILPEELIHHDSHLDETFGQFFEIESGSISLKTDGKGTFHFSDGDKVIETIWTGREED